MRLHYFQHVPYEGLDRIAGWATARHHSVSATRFYANETPPALEAWDLLCIMGGPMGVYEANEHPWMRAELAYIRSAIDAGKNVLGICLGAQLIAGALGAKVYPHTHKEIGWWPVEFLPAARSTALEVFGTSSVMYHWHGDTFDLPRETVLLASSAACRHQAFSVGDHVLALQFHPEISFETIGRWVQESNSVKKPGGYVQSEAEMKRLAPPSLAHLEPLLMRFLDAFSVCAGAAKSTEPRRS
jgi:GMP synthase-like glutamine amidotransferase